MNTAAGDDLPRRRIALVEFPPSGGLYQFALQLGEALAQAGDQVELITGPSPELTSRDPGCRVRSILPTWHPKAGDTVPEWWRRCRRVLRAGQHIVAWVVLLAYLTWSKPDVIVWSAWRFSIDGLGVQLTRRCCPRAVLALIAHEALPLVEQPGSTEMYKSSTTMNRVLGGAYAQLDVAYALGESCKEALIHSWPVSAPVHIIPHGDQGIYATADVPPADATGPIALSFGTITKHKGLDTLCDAWPKIRSQVPMAELVIAGPQAANVDGHALRERVAGLDGVHLNVGYVPVEDVPSYFANARCVVLPYKRGSQSGVAHLAHTLRRPVVATRVGDIPSVVQHEISGLVVEPDDPDGLATAIVRMLTDAAAARRMGDAGAEALAVRSSWVQVADQFRRGLPVGKD